MERKWPYVTWNPSYDIYFAKYRSFRSTNTLRSLWGILEEYLCPSSRLQRLFMKQFCQMTKSCPMSNQSMTWTVSLLYLPVCQMNTPGIWLYFTENVRRGCARRHMPEAADANNEIKKTLFVCVTMMNPIQRIGRGTWKILYEIQWTRNFVRDYWSFGPVIFWKLLDRSHYYWSEEFSIFL